MTEVKGVAERYMQCDGCIMYEMCVHMMALVPQTYTCTTVYTKSTTYDTHTYTNM